MTERKRQTMADVNHTNPHTGETFGTVYRRGPAVADGGENRTDAPESTSGSDRSEKTMSDVDHESPNDDVGGVWDRGLEKTDVSHEPDEPDVSDDELDVSDDEPKASDD